MRFWGLVFFSSGLTKQIVVKLKEDYTQLSGKKLKDKNWEEAYKTCESRLAKFT